jgi:hypothetical protein
VFTSHDQLFQKQNSLFVAAAQNENGVDEGSTSENSIELEETHQLYVEMSQTLQQFKSDLDEEHMVVHKL